VGESEESRATSIFKTYLPLSLLSEFNAESSLFFIIYQTGDSGITMANNPSRAGKVMATKVNCFQFKNAPKLYAPRTPVVRKTPVRLANLPLILGDETSLICREVKC